MLISEI